MCLFGYGCSGMVHVGGGEVGEEVGEAQGCCSPTSEPPAPAQEDELPGPLIPTSCWALFGEFLNSLSFY